MLLICMPFFISADLPLGFGSIKEDFYRPYQPMIKIEDLLYNTALNFLEKLAIWSEVELNELVTLNAKVFLKAQLKSISILKDCTLG